MGAYDQRKPQLTPAGTRWVTAEDHANEAAVDTLIERYWKCKVHPLPLYSEIDRYAERHGRIVAHIEIKTRNHPSTQYADVWLSYRKYICLMYAYALQQIPPIFVVQFTDRVMYRDLRKVGPTPVIYAGTKRRDKTMTSQEPMLPILIADMRPVVSNVPITDKWPVTTKREETQ